jgi:hypothetical protein
MHHISLIKKKTKAKFSRLRGFVIRACNKVAHGLQTRASGGETLLT